MHILTREQLNVQD